MEKKLFLALAILVIYSPVFAQSDFQEGFIVKQSNDTIQGFINNKGSLKTLNKCRFKLSKDSHYVDYTPEELKAFRVYDGGVYVSIEIDQEGGSELVFIEQLVDGIVDVFFYPAINDSYYLMRTEDGEIYKLLNTRTEVTNENGTYEKQRREYVYLLRYLLRDSHTAIKKVDNLPYEVNAMINLAEDYHNEVCEEYECIVYTKDRVSPKLYFGIYGGYSISKITVFDNEFTKNLNKDYAPSNDFSIGVFLNYMVPNISRRFSLQLDLMYQESDYVADTSRMNIGYLRIPLSIKYAFPTRNLVPSVWLGMSYNMWTSFSDENVVPRHLESRGVSIQQNQDQFGFYTGVEFSYIITERVNFFVQGKYEWYKGKHKNAWSVDSRWDDHFSSKSSFFSITGGFRF